MRVLARTCAKGGHRPGENEDAAAWHAAGGVLRACVADGATESAYAGAWARALAAAWARDGRFDAAWPDWDRSASRRSADVPWYVAAKAEQGAHAAALGVEVDGRSWRARSTGDCNLFVLDAGRIARAWPFDAAEAFGSSPALFATTDPAAPAHADEGVLERRTALLLASDAVAAYLLAHPDAAADLTGALGSDEAFAAWTADARQAGMRNDDASALLIQP